MGIKVSKNYRLLKTTEDIELEDYSTSIKSYASADEISMQCQKLIVSGKPLEAFRIIQSHLSDTSELYLPLHAAEFIEMISQKKIFEAMLFAQNYLSAFRQGSFVLNAETKPLSISIDELMGLLCYENPHDSILEYLMDPKLRYSFAAYAELIINPPEKQQRICKIFKCCKRRRT